ncbi:MAG: D-alanine--D-alanine ligase [Phycisphaeraceae bacterium]|nr:MAG: D-alanine--D-alanine ligase [Phycisphaeraceae bacterium]
MGAGLVTCVLVLGGGPDAEREVSLTSSQAVAGALAQGGRFKVEYRTIDRVTDAELEAMPGDVVFPVLHGPFGEGGPVQDMLARGDRPYIGAGPSAARRAMDKMGCKLAAAAAGVPTAVGAVLDISDSVCPFDPPVVVKPNTEGSSVGLYVCKTLDQWDRAHAAARDGAEQHPGRAWMVERFVPGRELTVGLVGPEGAMKALPIVEIRPAGGTYDYDAKYARSDTVYVTDPDLPAGVGERVRAMGEAVAAAMGVRHLARADFILTPAGEPMFLEINTMPGFTSTSLVPKAAAATGMDLPDLCAHLVELALGA